MSLDQKIESVASRELKAGMFAFVSTSTPVEVSKLLPKLAGMITRVEDIDNRKTVYIQPATYADVDVSSVEHVYQDWQIAFTCHTWSDVIEASHQLAAMRSAQVVAADQFDISYATLVHGVSAGEHMTARKQVDALAALQNYAKIPDTGMNGPVDLILCATVGINRLMNLNRHRWPNPAFFADTLEIDIEKSFRTSSMTPLALAQYAPLLLKHIDEVLDLDFDLRLKFKNSPMPKYAGHEGPVATLNEALIFSAGVCGEDVEFIHNFFIKEAEIEWLKTTSPSDFEIISTIA